MSAAIDDAAATEREPVLVDLALQGGGSHGAFTWGVLDRLLEEPWIKIEAISGTSAGAMNAAVLVDGWSRGGADGARAALDTYWQRVSRAAAFSPLQRASADTGRKHRFRAPHSISHQAVHHCHKCAHRPRTNLSQQPNHARRAAGLGMPSHNVPGCRDRRRGLLGRRFCWQSDHHPACPRERRA
jgi:hypothetical protein